jgi:hypothetical protein
VMSLEYFCNFPSTNALFVHRKNQFFFLRGHLFSSTGHFENCLCSIVLDDVSRYIWYSSTRN